MLENTQTSTNPTPPFIDTISSYIAELRHYYLTNDTTTAKPKGNSFPCCFSKSSGSRVLNIHAYMRQVAKQGRIEDREALYGLVLVEKLLLLQDPPKSINFKRLIAAALFISQKVLRDHGRWSLDQFAQISMIKPHHLEQLEITFSFCLDFRVHVTDLEYEEFRDNVLPVQPSV